MYLNASVCLQMETLHEGYLAEVSSSLERSRILRGINLKNLPYKEYTRIYKVCHQCWYSKCIHQLESFEVYAFFSETNFLQALTPAIWNVSIFECLNAGDLSEKGLTRIYTLIVNKIGLTWAALWLCKESAFNMFSQILRDLEENTDCITHSIQPSHIKVWPNQILPTADLRGRLTCSSDG